MPSRRRLERETQRNIELIWLTGRCAPDFKTLADFRKDNGTAIGRVCSQFVLLCRRMQLFTDAVAAIDGSKFKAVNSRDRNQSQAKLKARMQQMEASVARYLDELDRADHEPGQLPEARVTHLQRKIATVCEHMQQLAALRCSLLIVIKFPDSRWTSATRDLPPPLHAGEGANAAQ